MASRPPILFVLDRNKAVTLQAQLTMNLKRLVHSGTLRPGETVPSTRELSRDLQISRNTVLQAYDRLIGEGYLQTSSRRGVFVSESLEERNLRKAGSPQINQALPAATARERFTSNTGPIPFRPCQPDVRLFPLHLWNRARTRALRRHGA